MLTIICGTAKEKRLSHQLQVATAAAERDPNRLKQNILWLTPDQFTFETERSLLMSLPPSTRRKMIVTGFMRFSKMVMKRYGGASGRYADNLCKTVLMRKALSDCKDLLRLYQKQTGDLQFEGELLSFIRQLKFSGITPEDLLNAGEEPSLPENLRAKAHDLAHIAMHYEARLSASYRDALDDISAANEKLECAAKENDLYFRGKTVFLDGFKSFTVPQYDMIRMMLRQGAVVYVSLQLDVKAAQNELHSIYALTLDTYDRLLALAGDCKKIEFSPDAPKTALQAAAQNLFLPELTPYPLDDSVAYAACRDEYSEADYCFANIKSMIKDGNGSLRLRDFAVVYREESEYLFPIKTAAQKYDIPYCVDGGSEPQSEPLFLVCCSLLKAAYFRFSAADMLSILKSGLFACEDVDAAQFEEYLYVWNAESYKDFSRPFTAKLTGYDTEEFGAQAPLGDGPELIRSRLMAGVDVMRSLQSGTGKELGAKLYDALEQMGVLSAFSYRLEQSQDLQEKQQLGRVWNTFCEILTRLSDVPGEDILSAEEYYRLFLQSVKETRIKSVGQTIDCVMVGAAQTIRLHDPKVLWILGANDGIFPKRPSAGGGLFTDSECKQFSALDLTVGKTVEERAAEERFIAYQMVNAPTERLFVTYRQADLGGTNQLEGELIWRLETMFGKAAPIARLSQKELTTSPQTVLDTYCSLVRFDPKAASLYLDLLNQVPDQSYEALLETLTSIGKPRRYALTAGQTVGELYTLYERMLSPSEIEQYFTCPFAYYVKYGLKLRVKERAAYNPLLRGNILHHVIAALSLPISELAKQHAAFAKQGTRLPEADAVRVQIQEMVDAAFDEEIRKLFENPGRISAKDQTLAQSMKSRIRRIAENIYAEQLQSKFAVFAVECDIGRQQIKALEVPVEQGRSVRIRGRIDRLDTHQEGGKTYFRIIDYKTGDKKFAYAKLMSGEHLQMVLYEMAVASGGKGGFAGMVPAGVLYYPAKEMAYLKDRNASDEERQLHFASNYRMNGIVVDDADVLSRVRAMEAELKQYYIPVGYNKKHEMDTEALCSEEEYRKIEAYAKSQVRHMAKQVSAGNIAPIYEKDKNACQYCKYSLLCGKDIRTESAPDEPIGEKQAMEIIFGQEGEKWV